MLFIMISIFFKVWPWCVGWGGGGGGTIISVKDNLTWLLEMVDFPFGEIAKSVEMCWTACWGCFSSFCFFYLFYLHTKHICVWNSNISKLASCR